MRVDNSQADPISLVSALGNAELLEHVTVQLGCERRALVDVIAAIGEIENRRLHLEAACESMFAYCQRRLGMSEGEAYRRLCVARLARRFPRILTESSEGFGAIESEVEAEGRRGGRWRFAGVGPTLRAVEREVDGEIQAEELGWPARAVARIQSNGHPSCKTRVMVSFVSIVSACGGDRASSVRGRHAGRRAALLLVAPFLLHVRHRRARVEVVAEGPGAGVGASAW